MHRVFQRFIDRLSSAEDAGGLSEAMAIAVTALDLSTLPFVSIQRTQSSIP